MTSSSNKTRCQAMSRIKLALPGVYARQNRAFCLWFDSMSSFLHVEIFTWPTTEEQLIQQRTIMDHQVGKKFQRDMALQFFVTRRPYDTHPAAAKDFHQRVATKHRLSAGSIERGFEKAAWATFLRCVTGDFGSALLANSDYRGHFGRR